MCVCMRAGCLYACVFVCIIVLRSLNSKSAFVSVHVWVAILLSRRYLSSKCKCVLYVLTYLKKFQSESVSA